MYTFRDYNESSDSVVDEDVFYSKAGFKTTGVPKGFAEVPTGYFVYMIVALGKIQFISAGTNPWPIAEKLRQKYRGDRILYMPIRPQEAEETVEAFVEHYQPPHNFKARSIELSELDAILG